jgi:hypothetical protein
MEDEEAQCDKLEKTFDAERAEWDKLMNELISKLDSIGELAHAQVLMLSYRHMLNEKVAKYKNALNGRKSKDAAFKRIRDAHYRTGVDVRYGEKGIGDHVAADMAIRTRKNALLQTQVEYFHDTVDTLDKMGYAIRNRIELATRVA